MRTALVFEAVKSLEDKWVQYIYIYMECPVRSKYPRRRRTWSPHYGDFGFLRQRLHWNWRLFFGEESISLDFIQGEENSQHLSPPHLSRTSRTETESFSSRSGKKNDQSTSKKFYVDIDSHYTVSTIVKLTLVSVLDWSELNWFQKVVINFRLLFFFKNQFFFIVIRKTNYNFDFFEKINNITTFWISPRV